MDTATSIQDSTQRPPQVGDKSAGFINDEALMGAFGILIEQAKAIVRQEFKKQLEEKDNEISEKDKKIKELLNSIKVGDGVRTIGGIYGTVTNIKDDIITVSVGPDKARLVFARGAIANVEDVPVENTIEEANSK